MGYYTSYKLTSKPDVLAQVHHEESYTDVGTSGDYCFSLEEDGSTYGPCKWYDHEDDMREISKRHQGVVFKLSGEGEEPSDLWVKYFKNGKMQVCEAQITFPPYDERKLK